MAGTTRIRLTKRIVESLELPPAGRYWVYDSETRGLVLQVSSTGRHVWYLYRKVSGRPERIGLGTFPETSVEMARDEADRRNGQIADNINPNDRVRSRRDCPTLAEIFDDFIDSPTRTKKKRPRSEKTKHDYRLQFTAYLSRLAERKLSAITRAEIERLHNGLAESSGIYTANRVLALVKALFNSAVEAGKYHENPASRLRSFEEEKRDRFLTEAELKPFWESLAEEPSEKLRDFFVIALLTGQRRGNVLSMRWSDIDFDSAMWTIPRTKTGRHKVPLSDDVMAVLKRRHKERGECPFVLPGRHGGNDHLTDPMPAWRAICKRAGIKNLRIHDLRRSMGSWQTMTGASLTVVGKTLGHVRPETTMVYARLEQQTVRDSIEAATEAMMKAATGTRRKGARRGS